MPTVVTDAVLEHRRRLGLDKQDERWEGVWHLVNPPKIWHVRFAVDLFLVLAPRASELGLQPLGEGGVFGSDIDWRVPDQMFVRPGSTYGDAGWATAEVVVEIHSPGDDSYRKLPFYARRGVREVLIFHQDRRYQLYRPDEHGDMALVAPNPDGTVHCRTLDVALSTIEGPRLRVAWDTGSADL